MYKNFNITEKEKTQIMEMHESNGYKTPSNEMFLGKQLTKSVATDNLSEDETAQPVNESVELLKNNFKRFI
jgi:hypothetical protein